MKMWKAENALRSVQHPQEQPNGGCDATVVGRETEVSVVPTEETTRQESEPTEETADDTPYTHVSFFSESMTSESDRTLTRRRQPLPLPSASVTSTAPAAPAVENVFGSGCRPWMKFLLVWLCMILVVALRGGEGPAMADERNLSSKINWLNII